MGRSPRVYNLLAFLTSDLIARKTRHGSQPHAADNVLRTPVHREFDTDEVLLRGVRADLGLSGGKPAGRARRTFPEVPRFDVLAAQQVDFCSKQGLC